MMKRILMAACVCSTLLAMAQAKGDCPGADEQDTGASTSQGAKSCDPNEMSGPLGVGEQRLVKAGDWMDYSIYFENVSNATAAAQEVFVELPMDANLDWSTLELGEVAFGEHMDMWFVGKKHGTSTYAIPGSARSVRTEVKIEDGRVKWYLRDWDPSTTDNFPEDPQAGFLPPNDETHRGEGHLSYRVRVREDAPQGAVIRASAEIVFDANPMIETDPSWWNTVGDVRQVTLSLGDETTTNLTLVVGQPFGELPVPAARTGHDFAGWYLTEKGDDEPVKAETIVPAELETLYPRWTPQQFAVDVDGAVSQHAYGTVADLTTPASATNGCTNVVCVGWIGTGDVPAAGTSNAVTFTVTQESSLRWLYETNYWVSATAAAGGNVTLKDAAGAALPTNELWAAAGTNLTAEATENEGSAFARWVDAETGAELGQRGALTLPVNRPWIVRAEFTNIVLDVHSACSFAAKSSTVDEGSTIELTVSGGDAEKASSVAVYLTYLTAAAADIDLKAATVDGVVLKGGLKFPLALSWAAGEVTNRVIRIPVKTDKTVEDDETLVFQLAAAQGQELGETCECKVTIHDPGYDALKAKVEGGTATKAEKSAWDKLQKNAGIPYVAGLAEQADRGKVTGSGYCATGKKVTLKATANKGFVFVGWHRGDGMPVAKTASLVIDRSTRPAKDSATSTTIAGIASDVTYYAAFVTSAEDAASIAASADGVALEPWASKTETHAFATNVWAGVYFEWPIAASALSATTVKVAGLPSGLKFTAKPITTKVGTGPSRVTTVVTNVPANTIYGAPTAASKTAKDKTTGLMTVKPSAVKVTVTTAGKSKAEYVIDLTVDPLPAWAVGEFSGLASTAEGRLGSASMSVTAAGKVSGKVIVNGTNCTFSAASYDIASKTVGETNLVAKVEGKLGKGAVTGEVTVVSGGASASLAGVEMSLFRNVWKDKGAEPVPEDAQGLYTVKLGAGERGTGYLSLTVDKKGVVKVAGKAPDGTALSATATLMPNGDGAYFADLFCAPSAYKGGYVAGRLGWDADGSVSSDGLDWTSFNPQSTADYYAGGFGRTLDLTGARYVKTDAPNKLGVIDVRLSTPEGAELKTFSFTQSTGIWKGSLIWDFGDPLLNLVKVPFEGVLVLGEEALEGFGTYDVTASYIPYDKKGQPQKQKTYKVKESLPVRFARE